MALNLKVSEETAGSAFSDASTFRGVEAGATVRYSGAQVKAAVQTNFTTSMFAAGVIDIDGMLAGNSDTKLATQKAVKTYADTKQASLGFTAENVANKDTDGTLAANSDTKYPSQKAVKTYADQLIAANDAMVFKGVIDASANPNYPAADRGNTYRISVAGKIGGASGTNVEAGDLILCLTDGTIAGTQAGVGASWTIAQTNLDGAVIGPSSVTDSAMALFDGTSGKLIKAGGLLAAGVATALAIAVGSAGAFVVNGGALGTPSSGVATNLTGTAAGLTAGVASAVAVGGITGLGTSVATFLATPSSANLAAAITNETGSGALVFATTPTLVTPLLGAATGTSLVLGTATLGTNLLAVGGTALFNLNAAAAPTPAAGTGIQLVGTDATVARYEVDSFGAIATVTVRRANGTGASPTALASLDQIGAFNFHGYYVTGGPAYSGPQASIQGFATQAWTSTANGTKIVLSTTPNSSTTLTTALTIGQDQSATFVGVVSTPAMISSGASIYLGGAASNVAAILVGTNNTKMWAGGAFGWNSQNDLSSGSQDVFLTRSAAATLQQGAADAASPVAQTTKVQGVVAGTSNTAGADWTLKGSAGTGTGAGGSIIFQVAPAGSTGTSQNAYATALTITTSKQTKLAGNLWLDNTLVTGLTPAVSAGLLTKSIDLYDNAGSKITVYGS